MGPRAMGPWAMRREALSLLRVRPRCPPAVARTQGLAHRRPGSWSRASPAVTITPARAGLPAWAARPVSLPVSRPGLAAGLPPGLAAGLPPGLAAGLSPGLAAGLSPGLVDGASLPGLPCPERRGRRRYEGLAGRGAQGRFRLLSNRCLEGGSETNESWAVRAATACLLNGTGSRASLVCRHAEGPAVGGVRGGVIVGVARR